MANEMVFLGKAKFYNSRPTYPNECLQYIANKFCLDSDSVIADVAAGTGILTRSFLDLGCSVFAVEPNDDMFSQLKSNLGHYENVKFIKSPAENIAVDSASCDAIVIGTAFHWFDKKAFKKEAQRILKGNKYIAILRIRNNTPLDSKMYIERGHAEQDLKEAEDFFGSGFIEHLAFEYTETFSEERYINDKLSSATAHLPGESGYIEFVERCKNVYRKYFGNGPAELPFAVECYLGKLN